MTSILLDIARNRIPFTLSVGNRNVSKINGHLTLSNRIPEKFLFRNFHVNNDIFIFDLYSSIFSYDPDIFLPNENKIITGFSETAIRPRSEYKAEIVNTNPIFVYLSWTELEVGKLYHVGPSENGVIKLLSSNNIGFVLTPIRN